MTKLRAALLALAVLFGGTLITVAEPTPDPADAHNQHYCSRWVVLSGRTAYGSTYLNYPPGFPYGYYGCTSVFWIQCSNGTSKSTIYSNYQDNYTAVAALTCPVGTSVKEYALLAWGHLGH